MDDPLLNGARMVLCAHCVNGRLAASNNPVGGI
jgi:hypothetical protein